MGGTKGKVRTWSLNSRSNVIRAFGLSCFCNFIKLPQVLMTAVVGPSNMALSSSCWCLYLRMIQQRHEGISVVVLPPPPPRTQTTKQAVRRKILPSTDIKVTGMGVTRKLSREGGCQPRNKLSGFYVLRLHAAIPFVRENS